MPGGAAALKKVGIYERIQQATPAYLLASFCHWLPKPLIAAWSSPWNFRPYEYKRLPAAAKMQQTETV